MDELSFVRVYISCLCKCERNSLYASSFVLFACYLRTYIFLRSEQGIKEGERKIHVFAPLTLARGIGFVGGVFNK